VLRIRFVYPQKWKVESRHLSRFIPMETPLFRNLQYRYRYLKTNMTATNAACKKMQQKFKWNLLNSLPTWVPLRRSTKTQAEWAGQGIFRSARQPESWLTRSQDVNVRGLPSTTTKLAFTRNFIINKYPNTTILRLARSRGCRWNQREEKRLLLLYSTLLLPIQETVSRDFLLPDFFMNHFPPSPRK